MTSPRPGPDAGQDGPYEQGAHGAHGAAGAFEAAVDGLADPLTDPLPGRHSSPWFRADTVPAQPSGPEAVPGAGQHRAPEQRPQAAYGAQSPAETPREWYDPEGFERDWYGQQTPAPDPGAQATEVLSRVPAAPDPVRPPDAAAPVPDIPAFDGQAFDAPDSRIMDSGMAGPGTADSGILGSGVMGSGVPDPLSGLDPEDPVPLLDPEPRTEPEPRTGGRAERRRAAKGRGRRRAEPRQETAPPAAPSGRPMSRVEARRAARAAKDSPAVVASRVTGELFITLGVLMLLFVTYQLWWTNVRANQYAGKETHKIQDDWAKGDRNPGVFEAGQGFAIIHIPKLDVVAPIAEGISKDKVLDRGMVGHYSEGSLRTAMPSAKKGNFALAGHRNTHGEPFRYINRLNPGDEVVVETQDAYYTYEMTSMLPQTSPSNVSVIDPIPRGSGFTKPGRYITLTTCTPEFTSTYRLIVWGKMIDERPRSKGKPDALVG
ncbi:class E sortase [Streptomyces sp. NPDC059913]|uniref:class E sortase n=1 Tax=unclassified Streptomyces TaxID=2593676 RepID=UPI00365DF535